MTKILPLNALHEAAGARFGPFAGYSMPIAYPLGVMKEHLHTRTDAGLFDISHMAHIEIEGPEAAALVSGACPYEAAGQQLGTGKYTFMLNEHAGMIDDLIVSRLSEDKFLIVANGACADKDLAHLREIAAGFDARVHHRPRVFLALQGPTAEAVLSRRLPSCQDLSFMQVREEGAIFLSRSGYTGEDGFEIALDPADAYQFASGLAGEPEVEWIGLGARDSLRMEAGLPLYGQDMDETVDPITAGLSWAVPKSSRSGGNYIGAKALEALFSDGVGQRRIGLMPDGKAPVRGGAILYDGENPDAAEIGVVTSGGFGPSVGHPIALARVLKTASADTFFADVRGRRLACKPHKLPFVQHSYKRDENA